MITNVQNAIQITLLMVQIVLKTVHIIIILIHYMYIIAQKIMNVQLDIR